MQMFLKGCIRLHEHEILGFDGALHHILGVEMLVHSRGSSDEGVTHQLLIFSPVVFLQDKRTYEVEVGEHRSTRRSLPVGPSFQRPAFPSPMNPTHM